MWVNLLGYIASASVFATFCMSAMVPLRAVAILSNVLFAAFGALAHVYPVLVLHAVLLPVNVGRLFQATTPYDGIFARGACAGAILPPGLEPQQNWRGARRYFVEWRRRVRSRRDLRGLGDRDLWDMRLTRCDALLETSKPFWRR